VRLKIHSLGGNSIPIVLQFWLVLQKLYSVYLRHLFRVNVYLAHLATLSTKHAALLPENVTSLVCLRDWLKLESMK